tara:strand:+ start:245 stop:760 length:516 start_codon:yes stop_codon:yes gene_type:complete
MSNSNTFTGKTPAETYTKIVQITADNELLDGVGGEISPVFKAGATITGSVDVQGTITQNGVPLNSTTGIWSLNAEDEATINNDVGIGANDISSKLEVVDDGTKDFFLIKKRADSGDSTILKVDDTKMQMNGDVEIQSGVLKFGGTATAPESVAGGMYYNTEEKEFYLGIDD